MSIATKTGDAGETSLMYGRRVAKTDPRVEAYGSVDELSAALGVVRATAESALVAEQIFAIQKELVTVMGELATGPEDLERYVKDGFSLTNAAMVDRLTSAIDGLGHAWRNRARRRARFGSDDLPPRRAPCRRSRDESRNPALPQPPFRPLLALRTFRRKIAVAATESLSDSGRFSSLHRWIDRSALYSPWSSARLCFCNRAPVPPRPRRRL